MQNLIVFDQGNSIAKAYGIGKFVNLLNTILSDDDYHIYTINTYASNAELSIEIAHKHTIITIPASDEISNESYIIDLLDVYILNLENSIVFCNYTPDFRYAKIFKIRNINVDTIGIVHSFIWTWMVKGNERELQKHLNDNNNSKDSMEIKQHVNQEKEVFNEMRFLITLSKDSFKLLTNISGVDSKKIHIIPNGLKDRYKKINKENLIKIKNRFRVNQDEKILLYIGRLDTMKGIDILISAFHKVVDQINNCRLVVIGDGDFRIVSSKIGKYATKITFTGRISHTEVEQWYQIADLGIIPTFSEECTFVGIEMMMYSMPIVSTNGRGVRNMFVNNSNSLIVNCYTSRPKFEKELAATILRVLSSNQLRDTIKAGARRCYLENYTSVKMKTNYLNLLKKINI